MTVVKMPQPRPNDPGINQMITDLQVQARELGAKQTGVYARFLEEALAMSEEVAGGGEVFAPGVREAARRVARELKREIGVIKSVTGR